MKIDSTDKHIWFVRHAESIQNLDPQICWVPNEDIQLTSKGLQQAHELAENSTLKPDKIYISPYKRTIRTAAPYIAKLIEEDHYPMITVDKLLKEFNYYNTNIRDAVNASGNSDIFSKMITHYWNECNPYNSEGYKTENYVQFLSRVVAFLSQLLNITNTGTMVVFSHYYVITCIRNLFEGSVDVDNLGSGNEIFDLPAIADNIAHDENLLKEMLANNGWNNSNPIGNCQALYIHLRPYSPTGTAYRVLDYKFTDRLEEIKDGTVGEDYLAE